MVPPITAATAMPVSHRDLAGAQCTDPSSTEEVPSSSRTRWSCKLAGCMDALLGSARGLGAAARFALERPADGADLEDEAGHGIDQVLALQAVVDVLATTVARDESGVLEYREMSRD